MGGHILRLRSRQKILFQPLGVNYEIGLLEINFKFKNDRKKTVKPPLYAYKSDLNNSSDEIEFQAIETPIKRFFDLTCSEIEPSIISGSAIRNLFIHSLAFEAVHKEFKNIEYHKLINNNISVLNFAWPTNIEIIFFTVHCRQYEY